MNKIKISSVIVPEDRQRKELTDIDILAASILEHGQIQPIVLREDNTLIAGERRLAAHEYAGLDEIGYVYREDMTEDQLIVVEYIENAMRVDLSWKDKTDAINKYCTVRRKAEPKLSQEKLAAELCMTQGHLANFLLVSTYLEEEHEQVLEAPKFTVALNIAKRNNERRSSARLEEMGDDISKAVFGEVTGEVVNDEIVFDNTPAVPIEVEVSAPFENQDFTLWAPEYTGPKFNLIHCDFPYGIKADTHDQGASAEFGGYADGKDVYDSLIETLTAAMENIVAKSAHMIFWFSMNYYEETKTKLEAMGWKVNPMPLIWHKNDNSGIIPDPNRGPRQIYETAFLCSRGDRLIVRPVANLFSAPNIKQHHMSQKNVGMLKHFLSMLVDETTVMLDPTCGSGTAIFAAEELKAKTVLGLEFNYEFFERTCEAWADRGASLELDL